MRERPGEGIRGADNGLAKRLANMYVSLKLKHKISETMSSAYK